MKKYKKKSNPDYKSNKLIKKFNKICYSKKMEFPREVSKGTILSYSIDQLEDDLGRKLSSGEKRMLYEANNEELAE